MTDVREARLDYMTCRNRILDETTNEVKRFEANLELCFDKLNTIQWDDDYLDEEI